MKIAIISDTHLKQDTTKLDSLLVRLKEVDLILHTGDYTDDGVVEVLQNTGKFCGVWGNGDTGSIQSCLNEKTVLTLGSYRLGLCHGHGKGQSTPERAYAAFAHDKVDIIVFGHSHQPSISTKNKILMLNPGSPTNKRTQRWFSYIILELLETSLEAKLVFY